MTKQKISNVLARLGYSSRRQFFVGSFVMACVAFLWRCLRQPALLYADSGADPSADSSTATTCTEISTFAQNIKWDPDQILYWVDGIYYNSSNLNTRIRLSILLKYPQTTDDFVEKVLLADANQLLLQARYFRATDKTQESYVPFCLFDSLNPDADKLYLYIQVRQKNTVKKYRHTFTRDNLQLSKLLSLQLV